jgi:hypothetical protein
VPDVPLLIIESPFRAFTAPFVAFVGHVQDSAPRRKLTVIIPGFTTRHWWEKPLHNRDALRLRSALRVTPAVNVVDFTYDLRSTSR